MVTLHIEGPAKLAGRVIAPPDKSITHRALILAALGRGPCRVEPAGQGADNRSTAAVLQALGVDIAVDDRGYDVHGIGDPRAFRVPDQPLDCGNSGTTMRLMTGVLSAAGSRFVLTGDASLRGRPMSRLSPLTEMGARLGPHEARETPDGRLYPPFVVHGGQLTGVRHVMKIGSAQVKSALLLAGLFADGPTTVIEPGRSRDHTERMLRRLGVRLEEASDGALTLWPREQPWSVAQLGAAPDLSSAAFVLGAAALTESREVVVYAGVNPTRAGVLDALEALGVPVERMPTDDRFGEPCQDLRVVGPPTRAAQIEGSLTLRSIDELPMLSALAAGAPGETTIRDAAELRVKETDRIRATVELLQAFGVDVQEHDDGLTVRGGQPIRPAEVHAGHDHRIAMTAAMLGLAAEGVTTIHGAEIIDVSYPRFAKVLEGLGARVHSA